MQQLRDLWSTAVQELLESAKANMKKRQFQELKSRLGRVNSGEVLEEYMKKCQREFYREISAYVNANTAVRKGVKYMLGMETTGAPAFHYLPANMQSLVQAAVYT